MSRIVNNLNDASRWIIVGLTALTVTVLAPIVSLVALPIFALKAIPNWIDHRNFYNRTLTNGRRAKFGRIEGQDYTRWNGKVIIQAKTEQDRKHELMGHYIHGKKHFPSVEDVVIHSPFETTEDLNWLKKEIVRKKKQDLLESDLKMLRVFSKALIPIAGPIWVLFSEAMQLGGASQMVCGVCMAGESMDTHWDWNEAINFHQKALSTKLEIENYLEPIPLHMKKKMLKHFETRVELQKEGDDRSEEVNNNLDSIPVEMQKKLLEFFETRIKWQEGAEEGGCSVLVPSYVYRERLESCQALVDLLTKSIEDFQYYLKVYERLAPLESIPIPLHVKKQLLEHFKEKLDMQKGFVERTQAQEKMLEEENGGCLLIGSYMYRGMLEKYRAHAERLAKNIEDIEKNSTKEVVRDIPPAKIVYEGYPAHVFFDKDALEKLDLEHYLNLYKKQGSTDSIPLRMQRKMFEHFKNMTESQRDIVKGYEEVEKRIAAFLEKYVQKNFKNSD